MSALSCTDECFLFQSNSTMPTLKPWGHKSQVSPSSLVHFQPVRHSANCSYQTPSTEQRQSDNVSSLNSSFSSRTAQRGNDDWIRCNDERHCLYHGDKRSISRSSTSNNTSAESDLFKRSTGNCSTHIPALQTPSFTSSESSLGSKGYPSVCIWDAKQDDTFNEDCEYFSEAFAPSLSKHKRFCNTYNILNQSGLLGITLRTKELIQQNKHSQAQLQDLHVHTDLFLEALRSKDPHVWTKLQLTLKNSNSEE